MDLREFLQALARHSDARWHVTREGNIRCLCCGKDPLTFLASRRSETDFRPVQFLSASHSLGMDDYVALQIGMACDRHSLHLEGGILSPRIVSGSSLVDIREALLELLGLAIGTRGFSVLLSNSLSLRSISHGVRQNIDPARECEEGSRGGASQRLPYRR